MYIPARIVRDQEVDVVPKNLYFLVSRRQGESGGVRVEEKGASDQVPSLGAWDELQVIRDSSALGWPAGCVVLGWRRQKRGEGGWYMGDFTEVKPRALGKGLKRPE